MWSRLRTRIRVSTWRFFLSSWPPASFFNCFQWGLSTCACREGAARSVLHLFMHPFQAQFKLLCWLSSVGSIGSRHVLILVNNLVKIFIPMTIYYHNYCGVFFSEIKKKCIQADVCFFLFAYNCRCTTTRLRTDKMLSWCSVCVHEHVCVALLASWQVCHVLTGLIFMCQSATTWELSAIASLFFSFLLRQREAGQKWGENKKKHPLLLSAASFFLEESTYWKTLDWVQIL